MGDIAKCNFKIPIIIDIAKIYLVVIELFGEKKVGKPWLTLLLFSKTDVEFSLIH